MEDQNICLGAKGLYAYLTAISDDAGFTSPGTASILEETNISKDVCRRYVRELEACGCIETRRDLSKATIAGNRRIEYRIKDREKNTMRAYVDGKVFTDRGLAVEAKGLFAYLAAHADEEGKVVLTRERILKDLSCSKTTFTKYGAELERLGYLKRGRYYDEEGRMAGILYDLT